MASGENSVKLTSPPASYKSQIWNHFGFRETESDGTKPNVTTCKHCFTDVSYKTVNTSNMATHMKRHHPNVEISVTRNKPLPHSQMRLQDSIKVKLPLNSPRSVTCSISQAVGKFIATDMRPYSIVENPGFKQMVSVLEPKYQLPSRTYFSENVIPELYKETQNMVLNELKSASMVSLTTDGWTSRATQSYVTITAHFIDSSWNLKSYVLQTRPLFESHTSENLAEVLKDAVDEWNIAKYHMSGSTAETTQKPIAITTDNAANIVKAIDIARCAFSPHIRCYAHCLNLAAQKAMEITLVSRLLGRIRRVVTFFHSSSTATHVLKERQKALQLPEHKLIQDVKTRWNSSFDMISRYLEQQPAVYATFHHKDIKKKNIRDVVTLTETEVSQAEELVQILEPLKKITTILCSEHYPTISLIHPMKEMLLKEMTQNTATSQIASQVKDAIRKDIRSRYTDPFVTRVLEISCALDPRFSSLPYHDDAKKQDVYQNIVQQILKAENQFVVKKEPLSDSTVGTPPVDPPPASQLPSLAMEEDSSECVESSPTCSPVRKKSAMQDLFGEVFITKVEEGKPIQIRAEEEVNKYRNEANLPLDSNPLLWW